MRWTAPLTCLSVVLLLSSCGSKTSTPSTTTTSEGDATTAPAGKEAAREDTALVRFINADPDAKTSDLYAGDQKLFPDVTFKAVTAYIQVPRGYTMFKLQVAGGSDTITTRRELFPGRHYTIVALPSTKRDARLVSLSDNLGDLDPGESRVRLINATNDVDDLDLFKEGTNNRLARGVDAGATTSFTDIQPGAVEVHQAKKPTPMNLSMLPVEADGMYTYIIIGSANKLDAVQVVDRTKP